MPRSGFSSGLSSSHIYIAHTAFRTRIVFVPRFIELLNHERSVELLLAVRKSISASSVEDGVDEQKFGLSVEGLDFVFAL